MELVAWPHRQGRVPIVSSALERFPGTSAMKCCVGFFMGTVCYSFGGLAHPIYEDVQMYIAEFNSSNSPAVHAKQDDQDSAG